MVSQAKYIAENTSRDGPWQCGCRAVFLALNPMWGVKFFHTAQERNENHELQTEACKFGYAPPTGEYVNATPGYNGMPMWGFLTMVAKVDGDITCVERHKFGLAMRKECGIHNRDLTSYNVGIFEGELVCVDFSACGQPL